MGTLPTTLFFETGYLSEHGSPTGLRCLASTPWGSSDLSLPSAEVTGAGDGTGVLTSQHFPDRLISPPPSFLSHCCPRMTVATCLDDLQARLSSSGCNLQSWRDRSAGETGHLLEVSRDFLLTPTQCLVLSCSEDFLSDWELAGSPRSARDTLRGLCPPVLFQIIQHPGLLNSLLVLLLSIVHKNESSYDMGLELNLKLYGSKGLHPSFSQKIILQGKKKTNVQLSNIFQSLLSHASLYPLRHNFQ